MEKKHDLTFCPQCGVKLEGDEIICSVCGFKLAELPPEQIKEPPVVTPPPLQETVVVPPAVITPSATESPVIKSCPSCSSIISEHEIFCNNCGSRLTVDDQKNSETPPPVVETPVVIPPPPPVVNPISPITLNEIFCPACGSKNTTNDIFCNNCGSKLNTGDQKKTVTPPPVVDTSVPPPPPPPQVLNTPPVITNEIFCPHCKSKNNATDIFCNECGSRLDGAKSQQTIVTPPLPQSNAPIVPPVVQNTPPVIPQPVYQQSPIAEAPPRKKGMGALVWILIIAGSVIILGGGAVGLMQYKGVINVPFLSFIPTPGDSSVDDQPVVVTNYYVVHSFASIGYNRWEAVVSSVITSKKAYNDANGAKTEFNKAVSKKYPKDSYLFTNSVLCESYKSLPEAQSARSKLLENYKKKRYGVRSIDVKY